MTIHSSILAWRIPWTEESARLRGHRSQSVGHDWSNWAQYRNWKLKENICRDSYGSPTFTLPFHMYISFIDTVFQILPLYMTVQDNDCTFPRMICSWVCVMSGPLGWQWMRFLKCSCCVFKEKEHVFPYLLLCQVFWTMLLVPEPF